MDDRTTIDPSDRGDATPPPEPAKVRSTRLPAGTAVGRFFIRQPIGEGGFGVVYEAEQTEPVRRRVAVKVLRAGMDSEQVLARFEAERQALARMDHSGIARILDGGLSTDGRPWFAMELVKGLPLTVHCDQHRLKIRDRLSLFASVCRAVQHAHAKGVVHRDLKPGNILVEYEDGRSLPKVIDFGVAKAIDESTANTRHFTRLGQMVGTPEYMSPEQAENDVTDIDIRSDIYSLGVILYELLTGSRPFELGATRETPAALRRVIREQEAPRPSTRVRLMGATPERSAALSRIVADRGTRIRDLATVLTRDLDWIVMRCLEKDRERRYPSASELAADVERFLRHEPVLAGPPSTSYRVMKFYRRHRPSVIASAVAVVALVSSLVVSIWFGFEASASAERAREQQSIADRRAADLEKVAAFQAARLADLDATQLGLDLRRSFIEEAESALARRGRSAEEVEAAVATLGEYLQGVDLTSIAAQAIDEHVIGDAVPVIEASFPDQPLVQARLLESVSAVQDAIGRHVEAIENSAKALEIRRKVEPAAPRTLSALSDHALLLMLDQRLAEADAATVEALERMTALDPEASETTTLMLARGRVLMEMARYDEAESILRETIDRLERGGSDESLLVAMQSLGLVLKRSDRVEEARPYYDAAIEITRRRFGEDDYRTIEARSNLVGLLEFEGDIDGAERLSIDVMADFDRVLGRDHPLAITACANHAYLLVELKQFDEAEAYSRDALDRRERVLGPDHPDTLSSRHNRGFILEAQGDLESAIESQRDVIRGFRRTYGNEHPDTLIVIERLARLLSAAGRYEEALPFSREVFESKRRNLGDDEPMVVVGASNLAGLLLDAGDLAAAVVQMEEAVRLAVGVFDAEAWELGMILVEQAGVLEAAGRIEEALPVATRGHELVVDTFGPDHDYHRRAVERLESVRASAADREP